MTTAMDDDRRQELEILRRMTPSKKLDVMNGMIRQAVELKEAWLRTTEPDLDEEEIRSKARELVAGGST